ncbi:hypothetical protein R3P38DRAFT_2786467 [Favolaschia claudopus]|uniref:Uncharacterized protein n=1 Tax=Favolaschia claudopus TaxID=2862362 RepID=A0AAW0ARS2_9AGAR
MTDLVRCGVYIGFVALAVAVVCGSVSFSNIPLRFDFGLSHFRSMGAAVYTGDGLLTQHHVTRLKRDKYTWGGSKDTAYIRSIIIPHFDSLLTSSPTSAQRTFREKGSKSSLREALRPRSKIRGWEVQY